MLATRRTTRSGGAPGAQELRSPLGAQRLRRLVRTADGHQHREVVCSPSVDLSAEPTAPCCSEADHGAHPPAGKENVGFKAGARMSTCRFYGREVTLSAESSRRWRVNDSSARRHQRPYSANIRSAARAGHVEAGSPEGEAAQRAASSRCSNRVGGGRRRCRKSESAPCRLQHLVDLADLVVALGAGGCAGSCRPRRAAARRLLGLAPSEHARHVLLRSRRRTCCACRCAWPDHQRAAAARIGDMLGQRRATGARQIHAGTACRGRGRCNLTMRHLEAAFHVQQRRS